MTPRRTILVAVALTLAILPAGATAHQSNPDYESTVRSIKPPAEGLTAEMAGGDDRVVLVNRSDRRVVVLGYEDEPYVRLDADGDVFVNDRSPAVHLNEDRFGKVEVPDSADPDADPAWRRVGQAYRYEWHDHRAHWMGETLPGSINDTSARTKIFDWKIPIVVASKEGEIRGDLYWRGDEQSSSPTKAASIVFALAIILMILVAVAIAIRRRRAADQPSTDRESW